MKIKLLQFSKLFIILLSCLFPQRVSAQLSAADSLWFTQIFTGLRYVNDSINPGDWYINDTINSIQGLTNRLTENFKFGMQDFKYIDTMVINSNLQFDTLRNTTYNSYSQVFPAKNPLTYFEFKLKGIPSKTYSYYLPDYDTTTQSKYAFLIIPGNGENESSNIVQGSGYHNNLCYVSETLRNRGDVFCYIKPNEDLRAIYWKKNKLSHGLILNWLKNNLYRPYGINYLIELIATIRSLQQNYCKVFVVGLSEGGYSGLLASLKTEPTAAIISAGYSVGFDTSSISNSVLYGVFDSLVYHYTKDSIKYLIQNQSTSYLFTYGDLDPINMMQAEHDSNLTQQYFNDSLHCDYYYQFEEHTFPHCTVIDSFLDKPITRATINFNVVGIPTIDSIQAIVSNCSPLPFRFDMFRNDTLIWSRNNLSGDTLLTFTKFGVYDIGNIWDYNSDTTFCTDSIDYQLATIPTGISRIDQNSVMTIFPNPVLENLLIEFNTTMTDPKIIEVYSVWGTKLHESKSVLPKIELNTRDLPSGNYLLKVIYKGQYYYQKFSKF